MSARPPSAGSEAGALHVACAADEVYVPHTAAMLHSVLAHRGERALRVHFLHPSGLAGRSIEPLREMVEQGGGQISFLPIAEERIAGLPRMHSISETMWYRIYLPELLPDVERVLYLDGDTLVLDSLEPLWASDLRDSYVAAVTNLFEPWHAGHPSALGLAGPHAYFSSGVLLMNLDLMRRDDRSRALGDYAQAHRGRLVWPDQDALNVVLGARRLVLHPRWNLMNSMLLFPSAPKVFGPEVLAEARERPGIRHFEGPGANKPWHPDCEREMRDLYLEHRRQTPWPALGAEGESRRSHVMRRIAGARRRARRLRRRGAPSR